MPETPKLPIFLFLAEENKKHYETMVRMFPDEPIWQVALRDTEKQIEQLTT